MRLNASNENALGNKLNDLCIMHKRSTLITHVAISNKDGEMPDLKYLNLVKTNPIIAS